MIVHLRQPDEGKKQTLINRNILVYEASEIFPYHLEGLMYIRKISLYGS